MKLQSRQLRTEFPKQVINLSGLKPRAMAKLANVHVIDWLNRAKSAGAHRVVEIIGLVQHATAIIEEAGLAATIEKRESFGNRLQAVVLNLNAAVLHYQWRARIRLYGSSLVREYVFSGRNKDRQETAAVAFLFENLPLVHRIRRCRECRRWFFAVTEHQKYCGDNCRKRHSQRGEEFLEKRRRYMRDYRRHERERDMRAKKMAGRVSK